MATSRESKVKVDADLLGAFETASSGPRKDKCVVGVLLERLDPAQSSALQAALDNPNVSSRAIDRVLRDRNLAHMTHASLQNHRHGRCLCARV